MDIFIAHIFHSNSCYTSRLHRRREINLELVSRRDCVALPNEIVQAALLEKFIMSRYLGHNWLVKNNSKLEVRSLIRRKNTKV